MAVQLVIESFSDHQSLFDCHRVCEGDGVLAVSTYLRYCQLPTAFNLKDDLDFIRRCHTSFRLTSGSVYGKNLPVMSQGLLEQMDTVCATNVTLYH
jgi:hypothetical protein